MSKVVFVGNVPYNMGEEALIDVFKSVGQVVGFRLVFDRDTGKPKGYGFCEFADHETALSAVRNLNNTDVGGRPLRIDLADSDPFLEGKTTVRGEILDGGAPGPSEPRWRGGGGHNENRGGPDSDFLALIPSGKPLPPGKKADDAITELIGKDMPMSQLIEVIAQMKAFAITHPKQAYQLLSHHPQVAYAIFQGLLTTNIVPGDVLNQMLKNNLQGRAGTMPPPQLPPHLHPHGHPHPGPSASPFGAPPLHGHGHIPPQHGYPGPPPMAGPSRGMMPPPPPPAMYGHPGPHPPQGHGMPPHAPTPPPPMSMPPYGYRAGPPPQQGMPPMPPQAPTPPQMQPPAQSPQAQADQQALLSVVAALTPAQIAILSPEERATVEMLRSQLIPGR